jgi:hypothetical protein
MRRPGADLIAHYLDPDGDHPSTTRHGESRHVT